MSKVLLRLLFIICTLEDIFLNAQETEVCIDENLEVTNDNTDEEETVADDDITASGNIEFVGQANAKGSVKIFASSGGSSPFMQSTSFSQPFEETNHLEYNIFSPSIISHEVLTSPLFLGPNPLPAVFFSTSSFPFCVPYVVTRIKALEAYDGSKIILPDNIRFKLANINFLPQVIIPDIVSDNEIGCPMTQPVESLVTLSPKIVVTSPLVLTLGQLAFRPPAKKSNFDLNPLLPRNIGNIGLSIKTSLECYPSEDLDGIPIELLHSNDHSVHAEEDTSPDDIDSENNCDLKEETPITNMHFYGIVPVAGSFKINAKF